jgi:hypothetical protein
MDFSISGRAAGALYNRIFLGAFRSYITYIKAFQDESFLGASPSFWAILALD